MARILVADDDPAVRKSLARYLASLGHEVVEAEDGRAALTALNADGATDLVVTDINMPDIDGIELLAAVRERFEGLPVVAVSGGGVIPGEVLLGSAKSLGAVATVEKPFDLEELRRVIDQALEGTS